MTGIGWQKGSVPAKMSENRPDPELLAELLAESAQGHRHLCPRQVLGVRIGLYGLRLLGLAQGAHRFQNGRKRLLVIAETDGCGVDGIATATDTAVGRRTLRILDFGKVAATLVDTRSGESVRIRPAHASRELAREQVPDARSRWHAYLEAYQFLPDDDLLVAAPVELLQPVSEIISKAGARVNCASCGEEILNERELLCDGEVLCRACAGERYYRPL